METPKRIAIHLTAIGLQKVRAGHPWVFSKSITKQNKEGTTGDVAIIFHNKSNTVLGIGLYDAASPIRIKMLSNTGKVFLNDTFFEARVLEAFKKRSALLKTNTNAYRLLFGENDGFPGLIADVYDKVVVLKLYTAIWFPYLELIFPPILKSTGCTTIVIRLSRKLQKLNTVYKEGTVVKGVLHNADVEFIEHGVCFKANVISGHKTGYFLDHRHNRVKVSNLCKNKRLLDVFSYNGGFAVHALAKGASAVTSIDISKQALTLAQDNAALNSYKGSFNTLCGDAFQLLDRLIVEQQRYDVVVIDPPSFAKQQDEVNLALKKYKLLANLGSQLVASKGILVLASCSSRVSKLDFLNTVNTVLDSQFTCFASTMHDIDHPVTFKEGAYLKTVYYKRI